MSTKSSFALDREDTVQAFHESFDHPVDAAWDNHLLLLRKKLIQEEAQEVADAVSEIVQYGDSRAKRAALLKELADLQYVLSGTAVALGLPLEAAFQRVHESNMSKLGEDGRPVYREDGKVLKGPNYRAPELEDLIF